MEDFFCVIMTSPAWTHQEWCRPSDPINVIFKEISLDEIEAFLNRKGWKRPRGWEKRFTPSQVIPQQDQEDPTKKTEQDLQLTKSLKLRVVKRWHIRLWDFGDRIVAGVHVDDTKMGHVPTDFESVEQHFASLCETNPQWEVLRDRIELGNYFAGHEQPFNNGKATLIRRR